MTRYDADRGEWSNKAHLAARKYVYPIFFQSENLEFEDTLLQHGERQRILDGELGIDRIVKVHCGFREPLKFYIQERFRPTERARFRDISITEFNHETGQPSELYKIAATLFVYGYYDPSGDYFPEVVVFNVGTLLWEMARGNVKLKDGRFKEKNQSFVGIEFDELKRVKAMMFDGKNLGAINAGKYMRLLRSSGRRERLDQNTRQSFGVL